MRALAAATLSLLTWCSFGLADERASCEDKKPVLRYFDVRGRGEAIRMAMHDWDLDFDDVSFSAHEWGKDRDDGLKAKLTSEGKIAFGQVPLLEIDGLHLVQSHTIMRYLGRKTGWYIGDPAILAQIDLLSDGTEDVRKQLSTIKYSEDSDAKKQEQFDRYFADADMAARWLGFLDHLVGKFTATGGIATYAAGTSAPTHADYLLLDLLDYHESFSKSKTSELLSLMPNLVAWRSRMLARPKLRSYLDGPSRRPA